MINYPTTVLFSLPGRAPGGAEEEAGVAGRAAREQVGSGAGERRGDAARPQVAEAGREVQTGAERGTRRTAGSASTLPHHRRHPRTTTHTLTRFMALFPGLPRWAGTRKVKPTWILLKQETVSGSGISWAYASLHLAPDR